MARFLEKIASFSGNCIVYDDERYSYADLIEYIKDKSNLLSSLPKGSSVALIGDYDIDSIAFLLACYACQMIVAPLNRDELIGLNVDSDYINNENLQLLIDSKNIISDKLKQAEIEFIYKDGILKDTGIKRQNIIFSRLKNRAGLVLFSSGSTGKPKAIVHDLDSMLESYISKRQKSINLLLFLGFDHIGGLNTLFNTLSIGGLGITISNRKDINALAKVIQDYKIALLPASPSLLNLMLLSDVAHKYDLSSLRIITYGSEAIPKSLLIRLKDVFPKVRFHQTFGTSEVGIIQTKSLEDAIKLENIDYKIINNELFLRPKSSGLGYINSDIAMLDNEGYFATGDIVQTLKVEGEEYIKIIARSKEVINIGGEKALPSEIEDVIFELPYIKDCLVYGEKNAITGQSVSIKVVLDSSLQVNNMELKKKIRAYCKDRLAAYKIPSRVCIVDSLDISDRFKKERNKTVEIYTGGGGGSTL
ncbi:ANL family adenylate-forming protein [Helicobacter muridarum]|uniref:AMP-dependent synthetase and ligase n=2 Tax=Helicobacter muridarum TaxID=216 RepID=A0A377PWV4_9HELI|nr:fatty acid--CoA ligase family protein [Helicobacter muridarum]STQ86969.1 AMP-dependent synthetase and ligase [Helicobacter muridarum]